MSQKAEKRKSSLREAGYRMRIAERKLEEFVTAGERGDLREIWESYLFDFARALGKVIACALAHDETKPLGHKLKNMSQTSDEGLVYLREARNIAEHSLEDSAKYTRGALELGKRRPLLSFGPGVSVTVDNCVIDGQVHSFTAAPDEAGLTRVTSGSAPFARVVPAQLELKDVFNEEKRKNFPVPKSIWGRELTPGDAKMLAGAAYDGLASYLGEIRALLR